MRLSVLLTFLRVFVNGMVLYCIFCVVFYVFGVEFYYHSYDVSEVTIAGNLLDMYKNLSPANDLDFRYGIDAPTCRVDGMTVAGK